jgi:hypothetical protein
LVNVSKGARERGGNGTPRLLLTTKKRLQVHKAKYKNRMKDGELLVCCKSSGSRKKREEQTLQERTVGNTIKTIRNFSRPVQSINIYRQPPSAIREEERQTWRDRRTRTP